MRALKVLVVVMGVMLVVGFIALIVVIAGRVAQRQTATSATAQAFLAAPIDLPTGSRIEAMAAGSNRLVIALALPDGSRQLLVIDLVTGRRLGTIPLRSQP